MPALPASYRGMKKSGCWPGRIPIAARSSMLMSAQSFGIT